MWRLLGALILVILWTADGFGPDDSLGLAAARTGDNECTIVVASGNATIDGRPILSKNRDITDPDQKFRYVARRVTPHDTMYAFIGNFYTDDPVRCYMGVNEKGFAIINANCYNLPDVTGDGIDDGLLMRRSLEKCASVEDWEHLLNQTNLTGRQDPWIFGAMDATGSAKLYECSNFYYYEYDAEDADVAPAGVIIRSVFSVVGWPIDEGAERYKRAKDLLQARQQFERLSVEYILQDMTRDLYSSLCDPYPLPFSGRVDSLPPGYVFTGETINRFRTRSVSVIRGVLPDEDPSLATQFAMLGPPVLTVAVPLWVAAGSAPAFFWDGPKAPWYQIIEQRMALLYPYKGISTWLDTHYLVDDDSSGVFSYSLPLELWGIQQADLAVEAWRGHPADPELVLQVQQAIAQEIWQGFQNENADGLDLEPEIFADHRDSPLKPSAVYRISNHPNPFNANTAIDISISGNSGIEFARVGVYNVLGQLIKELGDVQLRDGAGSVIWDGIGNSGDPAASGVYLYRVEAKGIYRTGKMLLLR